jgi:hypothetical protein
MQYRHTFKIVGDGYTSNESILTNSRQIPHNHPTLRERTRRGAKAEFICTRPVRRWSDSDEPEELRNTDRISLDHGNSAAINRFHD